jgi:hypothetical protein
VGGRGGRRMCGREGGVGGCVGGRGGRRMCGSPQIKPLTQIRG